LGKVFVWQLLLAAPHTHLYGQPSFFSSDVPLSTHSSPDPHPHTPTPHTHPHTPTHSTRTTTTGVKCLLEEEAVRIGGSNHSHATQVRAATPHRPAIINHPPHMHTHNNTCD